MGSGAKLVRVIERARGPIPDAIISLGATTTVFRLDGGDEDEDDDDDARQGRGVVLPQEVQRGQHGERQGVGR